MVVNPGLPHCFSKNSRCKLDTAKGGKDRGRELTLFLLSILDLTVILAQARASLLS